MLAGAPAPDALAGRVVLVSGAHGGLGAACARAAAAAGATVVLLGHRVPKLTRVYDAIERAGGPQPAMYPLDLQGADPADYEDAAQRIAAQCGRLDGLLHCAADFRGLTPLELTAPEDFARAVHVNLTGPWWMTRACLPLLRQAEDGAVVFVHDDPRRVGTAYWGGYGVAQHGLAGLAAILADEFASAPVRICALQPGPMRTPLRARAFSAEDPGAIPPPERYARACVHLLADRAGGYRGRVVRLRLDGQG
ncbi:MAG TPA: SDR family NAD(P)-dependent oxidoreductase [Xanthomonadaceae bacterium]|nr:SDR family NAD(P)-dependent oxidoreductase [Xanthomonadaceae bacterium]